MWYSDDGQLAGLALTHVDDILHGSGTTEFERKVFEPLKKKFQFGSEEMTEFRYVGMHIKQTEDGILVDQNHYLQTIDVPEVNMKAELEQLMDEDGQADFRGIVGKIGC